MLIAASKWVIITDYTRQGRAEQRVQLDGSASRIFTQEPSEGWRRKALQPESKGTAFSDGVLGDSDETQAIWRIPLGYTPRNSWPLPRPICHKPLSGRDAKSQAIWWRIIAWHWQRGLYIFSAVKGEWTPETEEGEGQKHFSINMKGRSNQRETETDTKLKGNID